MYAGIDIGSQSTDVVIIDSNREIVSYAIHHTGAYHKKIASDALNDACKKIGIKPDSLKTIVGTGYGRKNIDVANHQLTEISCHAKGVNYLYPDVRTVLDIGGQDSKVIKIDENGNVCDFLMNEKCAAGTGRFIEVMARVMEVDLDEFSKLGLEADKLVELSSVCTVFAESEVISSIAEGEKKEDIINGIHNSICNRVISMMERLGLENDFAMTGGVAKNIGFTELLARKIGCKIHLAEEPQIVGALGAALFAYERA